MSRVSVERPLDRGPRDLVEDHAPHRHLRLQLLDEMPGDRLAFAVFVRREQELVGVLQLRLQIGDDLLLPRVDDVERLEVLVDVDAEARPGLVLVLRGDLGGVVRQVADVADRRLDDVVLAEVAGDRLRLGRRLDDHEPLALGCSHFARHLSAAGPDRRYSPPMTRPPRPSPLYFLIGVVSWPILRSVFRYRADGTEHLPRDGGYVLAAGHLSNLDPWAIGLRALAAAVPALHGQVGALLVPARAVHRAPAAPSRCAGAGPTRRRSRPRSTSPATGNVIAMFPEGTRRKKGLRKTRQAQAHTGAARIALEAGVPLVPAGIKGTDGLRAARRRGACATARRSSSTTSRSSSRPRRRASRPSG